MPNVNGGVLDGVRRIGGRFRDVVIDGGLPGAPLGFRMKGATQSGPPATGTWKAGDEVRDRQGRLWVCITGGTPGIWTGSLTGLAPTGDQTGITDYANIQGLLNLTGKAILQAGLFWISQSLVMSSGSTLSAAGMGITTIKAINGYAATQVGTGGNAQPGMIMIGTVGNGAARQSKITLSGMTIDMNEANVQFPLPGYANQNQCSPVAFTGVDGLTVSGVEIINGVGYALLPRACTNVNISDCVVITGQAVVHTYVVQDAIHVIDCTSVTIKGNILNTGNLTNPNNGNINVGDDCIAIQSVISGSSDVTITGNVIQATAARGISLVLGGAGFVKNVTIAGNTIANAQHEGIVFEYGVYNNAATYLISDVAIAGNTFRSLALSGSGRGITLDDASNVGQTGPGWQDVSIAGNVFVGITSTSGGGIYAGQGNGLQITANTFDGFNVGRGIQIGDNITSVSRTVSNFQVIGNTLNMASSAASSPAGIIVIDSPDGVVAGNTVRGPGSGVAGGIGIRNLAIGTAIIASAVTGNRVTGWATGIVEDSGHGSDYNTYIGNNTAGCGSSISPSGTHDVILDPSGNQLAGGLTAARNTLDDGTGKATIAALLSANGGTDTSSTAAYSTPAFTSGAAQQPSTAQDVMLYIFVKTSISVTLSAGPTSGAANSIVPATVLPVGAFISVRVPKSWYANLTCATMANLQISQVTC